MNVFLWFYCLSISEATLLLLCSAALFSMVDRKLGKKEWWQCVLCFLLVAVAAVILYTTVGSRGDGSDYQINLTPFHSYRAVRDGANPELYRSNFMNAALFYPAGLLMACLLPKKWPGWCRCLLAVFLLCGMSVGIEYLQYHFMLGQVEIDDVIHNTAGALTGSLAGLLIPVLMNKAEKRLTEKAEEPKN